ncbi:MAG: hypothetical protein LLG00_17320 [Planctomycetaceae bacterium]|nr:hypothetical protein [Planctomycetaceae bacterium]
MAGHRKIRELRFPSAGVNRRLGYRDSADIQTVRDAAGVKSQHATPWSVNCRPEDTLGMRIRGGSRPGLAKYCSSNVGRISAMAPIVTSAGSGTVWRIAVLAGGGLHLISQSAVGAGAEVAISFALGTEENASIQTESGADIWIDTASPPDTTSRLIVRNSQVYCVRAGGVSVLDANGTHRTLKATVGTVPVGCTFGCFYRDRLVLAG